MYIRVLLKERKKKKTFQTIRAIMHWTCLKTWPLFNLLDPEFIPQIRMAMIYGFLGNRAVIVTKNNKVYSFVGESSQASWAVGNQDTTYYLREIEVLCEQNIDNIACGTKVSLACTTSGKMYFWDNPEVENRMVNVTIAPTMVSLPTCQGEGMNLVLDIACGSHHFLVISAARKAYVWGKNDFKQVSDVSSDYVSEPVQVKLNKKVVQVACGKNFSLVVTENGEVYGWGDNQDGQLGKEFDFTMISLATRIDHLSRIVKVACGASHALALTEEGRLYAWGGNIYGQLASGDTQNNYLPRIIEHEMGRVSDIAALHSGYISIAVNDSGRIYMWGRCGIRTTMKPTRTPYSTIYEVLAMHALPRIMHKPLIVHTDEESRILDSLKKAFNDKSTSDLTIQVENRLIYVHKGILKIRCRYFNSMFQNDWAENNQSVITYKEVSYKVFKAFIKYLYTGIVDLPPDEPFELLRLADKYCEALLKRRCIHLIKNIITVENAFVLYSAAVNPIYNSKDLEQFCRNFIFDNITAVMRTKAFNTLNDVNVMRTLVRNAVKSKVFRA